MPLALAPLPALPCSPVPLVLAPLSLSPASLPLARPGSLPALPSQKWVGTTPATANKKMGPLDGFFIARAPEETERPPLCKRIVNSAKLGSERRGGGRECGDRGGVDAAAAVDGWGGEHRVGGEDGGGKEGGGEAGGGGRGEVKGQTEGDGGGGSKKGRPPQQAME